MRKTTANIDRAIVALDKELASSKSAKLDSILDKIVDYRSSMNASKSSSMERKLYLDGQEVQAPVLTDLEKILAGQLASAYFGHAINEGFISVSASDSCENGGLERMNLINWEPGRQQLNDLITSLQNKNLIAVCESNNDYDERDKAMGDEIWFDCDVLALLSR